MVDISNNNLRCVKHVFDDMKLKQLRFANNHFLVGEANGASKAKKKKIASLVNKFNNLPQGGCIYN